MAWLLNRNGTFHIGLRFNGRLFKRSLKTKDSKTANGALGRVEENLRDVERGRLALPENVNLIEFLLSGEQPVAAQSVTPALHISRVVDEYLASIPDGAMEQNSLYTAKIHIKHLTTKLGARFNFSLLKQSDLQAYVSHRAKQKTGRRGSNVSSTTIKKELATLRAIWSFAKDSGYVSGDFPNRKLKFPKSAEKARFQTWDEITARIEREGLSEAEQEDLWDSLFLRLDEIKEVCDLVETNARHPFIHPMVMTAAHTGARRSELIRSQISDFDFDRSLVTIHEKKRNRHRLTTRTVALSPILRPVLEEWFADHPGGRFAFCLEMVAPHKSRSPSQLSVDQAHHHFNASLSGKWKRIRGWHVLRHSFASNCAAKGIDQRLINEWMGHQTEEMVRRYRHLFPDQQAKAIAHVFGDAQSTEI